MDHPDRPDHDIPDDKPTRAEYGSGLKVPFDDKHTFASGASSSGMKPRYDLIPLWALLRIAQRFQLGAQKHGENNWQKGLQDKAFILDRLNHLIEHAYTACELVRNDEWPSDDDLAAICLNAIFAMGHQRAVGRTPSDIPF